MKRFHPLSVRETIRANPDRALVASAAFLLTLQVIFSEDVYHRISIAMIFLVFASKSWFNFVFAVTTHNQHGETLLSVRIERYFWALFGQSIAFSVLFLFAFIDVVGFDPGWMNLIAFRNVLRSFAIVAVLDVIIRGDLTVSALMDYIRSTSIETKDARDERQDARSGVQDRREGEQNVREESQNRRDQVTQ